MDFNTTVAITTTTLSESANPVAPKTERIIEACVLTLIAAIALVGNVSLWFIITSNVRLRTTSNALILCLSGADILVSSINMPIIVYTLIEGDWMFSQSACIFMGLVTMVTFIASVMSLAAISINRYIMICHPTKYRVLYTSKKTALIILGVWLLSLLLASPPLFGWAEYGYLPGQSFCFCVWKSSVSFTFFMVLVCFGGPCTAMTYSYFNILREVRKSRLRVQGTAHKSKGVGRDSMNTTLEYNSRVEDTTPKKKSDKLCAIPENDNSEMNSTGQLTMVVPFDRNPSYKRATETFLAKKDDNCNVRESTPNSEQAPQNVDDSAMKLARAAKRKRAKVRNEEIRLTASFLVVILFFVVSWLPFCVTMFWSVFSDSPVPRLPDMITLLLGCFSSCCNPIIYGVMNSKFRKGFKWLYCTWKCCPKKPKDGASSSFQNRSSSYA